MTRFARVVPLLAVPLLAAAPGLRAATHTVPAGTVLPVIFETTASSETSKAEEKVLARVREDVKVGSYTLPAGSELRGHVISVRRSGKVSGRAYLSLSFTQISVRDKTYPVATRRISLLAPETHGRDAAMIAGGAGAGAAVGALVDGGSGAAKGAVVGGAAGTGAVLATRGKEVSIPAGSRWRLTLARALVLE